ncbi:MAG: acetyl-CoA carboxylase biotin carboxyl carrier protein [Lachnospiraceae bacterium]|nr:acetyl-CoA carboxylase biotin carboxyl carrier protein [Lachnospiraceae bacterium]
MNWDLKTVTTLIDRFDKSSLVELSLEDEEGCISLKKSDAFVPATQAVVTPAAVAPAVAMPSVVAPAPAVVAPAAQPTAPETAASENDASSAAAAPAVNGTEVKAPMAGTFYRAASPQDAPYVEVGQSVKKGDTIGLIEAMKIMSEIPAPVSGVVRKILIENGEFAEFDAPIIIIEEA